jgi:hypothetical protein
MLQYRNEWAMTPIPSGITPKISKDPPIAMDMLRDFYKDNPSAAGPLTQLPCWIECWKQGEEPKDRSDNTNLGPRQPEGRPIIDG